MFASSAGAQGLARAEQQRNLAMFAKITNMLIAAVVATGATFAVATTVQAGPFPPPTVAEKTWMNHATGSVDTN
jgi:hypothetical protein